MLGFGLDKFKVYRRHKKQKPNSFDNNSDLLKAKSTGNLIRAMIILSKMRGSKDLDSRQIATYELALLSCQQGRHIDADKYLSELGYRIKLSPNVWIHDFGSREYARKLNIPAFAYDDVLPPLLLSALQSAFSKSSSFWTEHQYPTDNFFSYNVDLQRKPSTKYGPATLIHQLAHYLKPLVRKTFPEKFTGSSHDIASVEWWCHIRDESSGYAHQLHFDLDEDGLRSYQRSNYRGNNKQKKDDKSNSNRSGGGSGSEAKVSDLIKDIHPLVSSVLYLSDCCEDDVPPTFVTNQTIEDTSVETRGCFCLPKKNRLLLFDGHMLHGVIPQLPKRKSTKGAKSVPRITLMLGWWGRDNMQKHAGVSKGSTVGLGPNMPMPLPLLTKSKENKQLSKAPYHDRTRDITVIWPLLLHPIEENAHDTKSDASKALLTMRPSSTAIVPIEGPVWVSVATPSSDDVSESKSQGDQIQLKTTDKQFVTSTPVSAAFEGTISLAQLQELRDAAATAVIPTAAKSKKPTHSSTPAANQVRNDVGANSESTSSAVEFISKEDLDRLRSRDDGKEAHELHTVKHHSLKRKRSTSPTVTSVEEGGVVFVGKWFLKSADEIRNDVLGISC